MNNEGVKKLHLRELKLTHYYYSGDGFNHLDPIATSVELVREKDLANKTIHWYKVVTTIFKNNHGENDRHEIREEIGNIAKMLDEIETIDLPNLKNNYYMDSEPENYECWEIQYNYHFKIYGTSNKKIPEYLYLSDLLGFENIIQSELKYIDERRENSGGV